MKQQEYEIFIRAKVLSTLSKKKLESKLVASLYDTETEEKISDGDGDRFEILDYDFTSAYLINEQKSSFIVSLIKELELSLVELLKKNGYTKQHLDFQKFLRDVKIENFIIDKYLISRIYTLAEVYFSYTKQINPYGKIIEIIASSDI